MLKFDVPPTPDTTEFTPGTLNRLSLTGVHKAESEIRPTMLDSQRGLSAEEVVASIGEVCGRVIRGNKGLETPSALVEPIDGYIDVLTEGWENTRAIAIFRDNFLSGAIDEGIHGVEVKEVGLWDDPGVKV